MRPIYVFLSMSETTKTNLTKKKKLKKIIIIVASVLAFLAVLGAVLPIVLDKWFSEEEHYYNPWLFFEPDWEKNILEDELYLRKDRGIYYNLRGNEQILTPENLNTYPVAATFFYEYFDCLVRGDYENYPSFYTESCLADENFQCPEKFTMQGIYDIHVNWVTQTAREDSDSYTEIYEVSYRIFENNGTYRKDILPDETKTRVFEIKVDNGVVKINSITKRQMSD